VLFRVPALFGLRLSLKDLMFFVEELPNLVGT